MPPHTKLGTHSVYCIASVNILFATFIKNGLTDLKEPLQKQILGAADVQLAVCIIHWKNMIFLGVIFGNGIPFQLKLVSFM